MIMQSSPLLRSMAASVDREREREAGMRRRSHLAAAPGKPWADVRYRLLRAPGILRSINGMLAKASGCRGAQRCGAQAAAARPQGPQAGWAGG